MERMGRMGRMGRTERRGSFRKALVLLGAALVLGWPGGATAVEFDVAADTPLVVRSGEGTVIVRALVRPETERRQERAPLAVALVLDKSGSMEADGKLEHAKIGALEALQVLDPRDMVTVVTYDSSVRVAVRPREVGQGARDSRLTRAIRRLRPQGNTALYEGVLVAMEELLPFAEEGYIPRLVLLSDGQANVGPTSRGEIQALGRQCAQEGITLTTIGLGLDYNEDLMTALASSSGGNAYFVHEPGMLPEIFGRDMKDAVSIVARRVRIKLRCPEGVHPVRSLGRTATAEEENSLEVTIENLYGSGEKYALFELEVSPDEEALSRDIATVELSYVDPATGKELREERRLAVSFTDSEGEALRARREEIVSQTALALNAEAREKVLELVDEGKAQEAQRLLHQRQQALAAMPPAPGSGMAPSWLSSEIDALGFLEQSIASSGVLSSHARKQALNDAYVQKNQQAPVTTSPDVSPDVSPDRR